MDRVLTFEQMKELLEMVSRLGVGGVEVTNGDFSFRASGGRELGPSVVSPIETEVQAPPASTEQEVPKPAVPTSAVAPVEPAGAAEPEERQEGAEEVQGYILTSPIVGTFYLAPSPEADPYVQPGDRVEKGQVLCIVEAMKLMNEIECDVSGVVLRVLAENGKPVEFGEPLFSIETD